MRANMENKWNLDEKPKNNAGIWIESILGASAIITMFFAVLILSAAFI